MVRDGAKMRINSRSSVKDEPFGLNIGASVRDAQFDLAIYAAWHGDRFGQVLVEFAKYASLP